MIGLLSVIRSELPDPADKLDRRCDYEAVAPNLELRPISHIAERAYKHIFNK